MIKAKIATSLLVAAISVSGCTGGYAGKNYEPIVDVYGSTGKDPSMYASDLAACQQLAEQTSQVADAVKSGGVGVVVGAGAGAIAGAIAGVPGMGAGYGAALGGLASAAFGGQQSNVERQGVVMKCLQGRGWTVVGR